MLMKLMWLFYYFIYKNNYEADTFCMYVPVPSQDPVIQWMSFVEVLQICFSFIFCT